jgi:hypothetical protein
MHHHSSSSAVTVVFSVLAAAFCGCSADSGTPATGSGGSSAAAGSGGAGATASGGTAGVSGGGSGGVVTGTGGTSGTGGTAGGPGGTAGMGGSSGRTGSVACTGSELLCEDFEDVAVGSIPSGGPWVARDGSCSSGNFSMGVTGELSHLGNQALKVTNHSWAQCRLAGNFGTVDDFWVRAFIYWEESVDFADKEILALDLLPQSGLGKDDPAIRFGSRSKDPCIATPGPQITIIGLSGGEQTGCSSSEPPKGQWHCFEAHVTQSSAVSVKTYINDVGLSYQSSGKPVTETIDTPSAPAEKINHIRLGFFTHNSTGMGNVYLDDVAVSTTRLGCGN